MKKADPPKEKKHKSRPVSPKPLRVLIVEDNEDDALLMVRELKKGGYNPEFKRVETAAAMKKALKEEQWDIILCDYSLPNFNAPRAISLLRESNTDIPLILVSGAIGEETAADCMIMSARDFIRKNNLSRLCPAIARELQETKTRCTQKLAEEALRESENFLGSVFESIQDGISILDKKLNIIGLNETHKKWYMHKAPLVGKKCYQAYHDRDKPCSDCPSQKTIRTGKPAHKIVPKEAEGKIIGWLEIYSFPLKDSASGEIRGVIEYVRDITERRHAEEALQESEDKYRNLVERANDGIGIAQTGVLCYVNKKLTDIGGYTVEELIGKSFTDFFAPEEVPKALNRYKQRMAGKQIPPIYETVLKHKNGSRIDVELNAGIVSYEGKPANLVIVRDITYRKQAEEKLKNSEEKYRLTFASTSDIIFTLDAKLQITNMTPSVKKILGLDEEDLIGKHIADLTLLTPDSVEKGIQYTKQILSGKYVPPAVYEYIGNDKKIRFMEVIASPIIRGNKIIGVTCVARNITDRVNTENILKEKEENFRRSLDESPLGIRIVTANGETIFANEAILNIYGYKTVEELNKTPAKDRYTPESYADYQARKAIRDREKENPSEYEISIVRKNGEIRHLEVFRKEITWNGKKQFQVVYHDITKQKAAEQSLHQSEKKYRTILETMEEGYYEVDLAGNTTFVNGAMCQIHGYSRQEVIGRNNQDYTDPETAKNVYKAFHGVYLTGNPGKTSEHQIIRKDGSKTWIEASITLRKDAAGKIIGFKGIVRDISERKMAEDALRESEEKYRIILETMEEGFYETDLSGNITYANDAMCRIHGYSREELIGMNYRRYSSPDTADDIYKAYNNVYKTEIPCKDYSQKIIRKDGEERILDLSFALQKDAAGRKIGFQGMVRDITERKQLENKLIIIMKAVESSSEAIGISDPQGHHFYQNKAYTELYGYASAQELEAAGGGPATYVNKSIAREVFDTIMRGDSWRGEAEIISKSGRKFPVNMQADAIKDDHGRIIGLIGIHTDITERKAAEEKLNRKHEELETMIESSPIMIYFKDLNNRFTRVNKAVFDVSGLSREEMEGKSNEEINPRQAERLLEEDRKIIASGEPIIGNVETIKTKKGTKILRTDKVPYKDKNGNIIGIIGFSVDITEQKNAQDALAASEEKYRSLVENAQEGVYQTTPEGKFITVNNSFARILGYNSVQEILKSVTDITNQLYVYPKDRERLLKLVEKYGSVTNFEIQLYRKDGSRIWLSLSSNAALDDQKRVLYYQGMIQDISEKKQIEAERLENVKTLRKALGATINAMAVTVETRDPYTAGHQRRVADLARAIATEMKLTSDQIDGVRMAGMIHDIGKISIPSEILTKPTQLSALEYNLIKTHPDSGHAILKDIEFPWPIARIVLEHHERVNGSGYPHGLKNNEILVESKILAVADVVEAISSHRPYRAAHGIEAGLQEIAKNRDILYAANAVDACLRLFREKNYTLAA